MALDVDGKVALITGGSNGIGEGVARHLAGQGRARGDRRHRRGAGQGGGRRARRPLHPHRRGRPGGQHGRRRGCRRGVRRPAHRAPQRRRHLVVRHGRRFRPGGLPALHGHQPRRRRLRDRGRPAAPSRRAAAGRSWPPRPWPAWWPRPSTRSTPPTSTPSSAWSRSLGQSYEADGIRVHALCPSFAYTNIIKGSEQTLLDMGFPIIDVADVVDGLPAHPRCRQHGQCWYVVAGRESEPFQFRRAPGPRARLSRRCRVAVPRTGGYALATQRPTGDGSRRGAPPQTAGTTWLMAPERRHGRAGHGRAAARLPTRTTRHAERGRHDRPRDAPRRTVRPAARAVGRHARWPSSSAGRSAPSPAICWRRTTRSPPGSFPWVTLLVNLTGSLAIGLLVPLTEHVVAPVPLCSGRSSSSASSAAGPPIPRWPSTPRSGQGRRHRHLRGLSRGHRRRRAGAGRGRPRPRPADGADRERLLPHSRPRPGGRGWPAARAPSLRALLIHHVGVRRSDPLPLGHHAGQRVGVAPPRHPDRALASTTASAPTCWPSPASGSAAATRRGRPPAGRRSTCVHTGHRTEAVVYTLGGLVVCLVAAAAGIGLMALA